jgi:hypothetical protein
MPVLREIFSVVFPKFFGNLYQPSISITPGTALRLFDSFVIMMNNQQVDETNNFEFEILQSLIIFILRLNKESKLYLFPYKLREALQEKKVDVNKIYEIEIRYVLLVLLILASKIHDDYAVQIDFAKIFYKQLQNIEPSSNILAQQVATTMRDITSNFLEKETRTTLAALYKFTNKTKADTDHEYKKLKRKLNACRKSQHKLYSHSKVSRYFLWHLSMSEHYLFCVLGYNVYFKTTSNGINITQARSDALECYLQHHQQELNLPTPATDSSFIEEYLKTLKPERSCIPKSGIKRRHSF